MKNPGKKFLFYQAVRDFLRSKRKTRAQALKDALDLVPGAHLSYKVDKAFLERVYASIAPGDVDSFVSGDEFAVSAFIDLSRMRSRQAGVLFDELCKLLIDINDIKPVLFKVLRQKRCRYGGGLVMVYTSNPGLFVKLLDETPGRGSPFKGKLVN